MDDDTRDLDDGIPLNAARRSLLALLPGLGLADVVLAQDPTLTQPSRYRTVLENQWLRVIEVSARPGMGVCGDGMHSHPAHLTVVLTSGKVRVKLPNGKVVEKLSKAGDVFWSEAETHEVENLHGADSRGLLVELKSSPKT